MKHLVIMLVIAVAVAGTACTKRYSKYGYEQPTSAAPAQQK